MINGGSSTEQVHLCIKIPDGPQACRTYCRLVGEAGLVKEALPIRRTSPDAYFILLPWVFSPGQGTGRILREYLLLEYKRDTMPWGKN